MSETEISIDDLLERQGRPLALLATIEALPNTEDRVKVTPFVPSVGCPCSRALDLDKSAIASLKKTDQEHVCCGKTLMVVEVALHDATLADVFRQLTESIRADDSSRGGNSARVAGSVDPYARERYWPARSYAGVYAESSLPDLALWEPHAIRTGRHTAAYCGEIRKEHLRDCYRIADPAIRARCKCFVENEYGSCLDPYYQGPHCE